MGNTFNFLLSAAAFFISAISNVVAGQTLPDSEEKHKIVLNFRHKEIKNPSYLINLDNRKIKIDTVVVKAIDRDWIKKVEVVKGKKHKELINQYPNEALLLINLKAKYLNEVDKLISDKKR